MVFFLNQHNNVLHYWLINLIMLMLQFWKRIILHKKIKLSWLFPIFNIKETKGYNL